MSASGWWKKPAGIPPAAQPPAPATAEVRARQEPQVEHEEAAAAEVAAYSDPAPAPAPAPAAVPERPAANQLASGDANIGDQVNQALGEFEARLDRLKEQLDGKLSESKELEAEIVRVEKEQAKAFKQLLKANPEIRKILAPKAKSRPKGRRPSRRKAAPATETEALR